MAGISPEAKVANERRAEHANGLRVVYIVGNGRSGSTLLGNVLGEIDGFFHAGELRTLWDLGLQRGRLCGCGAPVGRCNLWQTVLEKGFGYPLADGSRPQEIATWQRNSVRVRNVFRLLRAEPGRSTGKAQLDAYVRVATQLYRSIAEVTGARVIVDSSKRTPDAALLALLPDVVPFYVHLVRDPRAVAYSWRRRKESPGEGRRQEMLRHSPLISTRSWMMANLLAEAVVRVRGRGRSLRVRYEDFVARPRSTIEDIIGLAGERPSRLPFVSDHLVQLGAHHTAGGNPGRLRTGPTTLREDDEWIRSQARGDRFVATTLAITLLHRYGYPLRPGGG